MAAILLRRSCAVSCGAVSTGTGAGAGGGGGSTGGAGAGEKLPPPPPKQPRSLFKVFIKCLNIDCESLCISPPLP